jgi:large subunit ribosomal protein L30
MPKILQIKLARSTIGYNQRQKDTARALGLRRLNQVVEKEDTPDIRGMVNTISHLVEVTEKTN